MRSHFGYPRLFILLQIANLTIPIIDLLILKMYGLIELSYLLSSVHWTLPQRQQYDQEVSNRLTRHPSVF